MPQEPSAAELYGRDFPAGAVVSGEGDGGRRMYVLVSGPVPREVRVEIRATAPAAPGGLRGLSDQVELTRRFDSASRSVS